MNRPEKYGSYTEWQGWFLEKIERDFGPKIFFVDERGEVRQDYESLKHIFGKTGFGSN